MQTSSNMEARLPSPKLRKELKGLLIGKVGIITGASRGIGAATATVFAEAGAKVVLAARNQSALESVMEVINSSYPGGALAVPTDVTNPKSVESLVEKTLQVYGKLDVAFNNAAGGHMPSSLADMSEKDFNESINASLRGTFLSMKYEIPAMLKSGGGAIVNMSSTAGLQGVKGLAGYVAAKHGIIGLTRSAAIDYARQNIRVNAVAPGPIFTERMVGTNIPEQAAQAVPMGRVGNREEVSNVVAWLSSELSSFVTGETVTIDGGRMAGFWFSAPPPQKSP